MDKLNDKSRERGENFLDEAVTQALSENADKPAKQRRKKADADTDKKEPSPPSYSATKNGTFLRKGDSFEFLSNINARIIAEIVVDDGSERKRQMEIECKVKGNLLAVVKIPCGSFAQMSWVISECGSAAQIAPGFGVKDHLRYAIQVLSGNIPCMTVYEHTGWREINGQWVYLSQGAVIGADGVCPDINVTLTGNLADYALKLPEHPVRAVQASLQLLECAPPAIAVPLFLAAYRALLGEALPTDFSLFLAGVTGSRKTELAAQVQAHFGQNWHGKKLPGSFSSTANALERHTFCAKDAATVVDDFCPQGSTTEVGKLHTTADRLFRAQGNQSGRQRMNPDGSLRPTYYPRGLIIATGEDIPRGQSLRGRLLILEFTAETVNLSALTTVQQHAANGRLAEAAGCFCQWLAPRIPALKKQLPARLHHLRTEIVATAHSRHPDTLAELIITAEQFAEFAIAQGVTLPGDWLADITAALMQAGQDQQQAIAAEEPAARFVRLVESALSSGRCHLKPMDGKHLPNDKDFTAYGWQLRTVGLGANERADWYECGPAIGRFKRDNTPGIYLDPEAAYGQVQRFADEQGHSIPLQQRSLVKALYAKGYLLSRSEPRFTVNQRLPDGSTKRFLHLRVSDKNSGNSGNSGNKEGEPVDYEDEISVATNQNADSLVATVATEKASNNAADSGSVATNFEPVATNKNQWQQKSESNPLENNENLEPVATVATVATNFNTIRASSLSGLARRCFDLVSSKPGGITANEAAHVIDGKGVNEKLLETVLMRLAMEGQIGRRGDRFIPAPDVRH